MQKGKAPKQLWWLDVGKPNLQALLPKEKPGNQLMKFSGYSKFTENAL